MQPNWNFALREGRKYHLRKCTKNGWWLARVPEALTADYEIVLAAVRDRGAALRFAAEELRNDFEVVLSAVREHPYALWAASLAMRNNEAVATAAVLGNRFALECVGKDLLLDRDFMPIARTLFYIVRFSFLDGTELVRAFRTIDMHIWSWEGVVDLLAAVLGKDLRVGLTDLVAGTEIVEKTLHLHQFPGIQPPGELSEYTVVLRPRTAESTRDDLRHPLVM
eukprot:4197929-Amphidinium_carterae.1